MPASDNVQDLYLIMAGLKQRPPCVDVVLSASRPAGVCVEESFEDEELQVSRQDDDEALGR